MPIAKNLTMLRGGEAHKDDADSGNDNDNNNGGGEINLTDANTDARY